VARGFWRKAATDVAGNRRVLLVAWLDGALVGTVQLDLDLPQDQSHRAALSKLLVDPAARRRGVARALLQRAEQTAQRLGRPLLVLDTQAGDPAEPLYRSLGWQEVGRIPGGVLDADGTGHDAVRLWKRV
jgi:GNAT superfamily N-acetyltransferase